MGKRKQSKRKPTKANYGAMCIPGRAEDGSDSAWFVVATGHHYRPGTAMYIGDGDAAHERARRRAAKLNAARR